LVAVTGNTGLKTGSNTVSVAVTAADGSKKTYTVTVVVAQSSNTNLSLLTVNGTAVSAGEEIELPARTTSTVIKVVTEDPDAKVSIVGRSSLIPGYNSASVTVTAADGVTTAVTSWSFKVLQLSSDTDLKTFTANGISSPSSIDLPVGTNSVAVVAFANDGGAKVEITGNTGLSAGSNTVRVRVTAANGDVRDYTFTAKVASRSANANLSDTAGGWTINGIDVSSAGTVVELPAGTSAITASAKAADGKATLLISGTSNLLTGLNTVKFTVTAEDGTTTKIYERSVRVKALSSNTRLTSLTVADSVVESGSTVYVPAGTTRVSVLPVVESDEARFTILGNTSLVTGSQDVVVTVTAPSGDASEYRVTVVVAAPASNTNLSLFTVNGIAVTNGASISVASGTSRVRVAAVAEDAKASVAVTGKSGLTTGANTLVVTVKALSGDSSTYTVTVNVGN
jgi:hypothetical protein